MTQILSKLRWIEILKRKLEWLCVQVTILALMNIYVELWIILGYVFKYVLLELDALGFELAL
jgi:hypothetical protein